MNRAFLLVVVISFVITSTSFVYYEHNQQSSSTNVTSPQTLNQMVRNDIKIELWCNFNSQEYKNVDVNISTITNNVMDQFYVLQNNTSFIHYYKNYSYAFNVGSLFDFNTSQFNSSDPIGLNLDYFYFTFGNILNSSNSNLVNSCQTGSLYFSIDIGTGEISAPQILVHRIIYEG